jgi:hypothetical protein
MRRDRFIRVQRPEATALTADERRGFRQVERGLRATDPRWYATYCPRGHRRRSRAQRAAAVLSLALMVLGMLTAVMPALLCGVILLSATVTSQVSARAGRRRAQRGS